MPTGRTNQKALCVYCGSREGGDPAFTEAALALAELLVRENCRLIYGGGNVGLMGVLARRHLALGGTVTGVIPDFLRDRELALESVTEMIVTASMHARKQR
ncbi:MAG: LOG family protein, partial [Pseudomonadota bacterium]